MTYEQIIQRVGNRMEPKIYYYENNVQRIIDEDNIVLVNPHFEANLVGTLMIGVEVELKVQLPTNTDIYVENKAVFGQYNAIKEFGIFRIKDETYNANERTYTYNLYDDMLGLMIDYEPITMIYPCTVFQYFQAFVMQKGFTTNIQSLPNGDKIMNSDVYEGINFTNRDVLEDIGQATATLFKSENKVIKKCEFGTTPKVIDDDILMNKNVEMGEHYGPINVIVLSRAAESDNVYYPSILPANPIEFKIKDNQLMNNDDRSDYLQAIYNELNGLEFDIYDCALVGYGGFEPLDKVQIKTIDNGVLRVYNSYVFNNSIKITQGYEESIFAKKPNETKTDYKYASTTDKAINQVTLIVKKQEGIIEGVVSRISDDEILLNQTKATQDELGQRFEVATKNIDANGNITEITTVNGYTFNKDGLNIYTNENSYNVTHNNTGSYYKDGDKVVGLSDKDGAMYNNLKIRGIHQYSYNESDETYDFSDERVEVEYVDEDGVTRRKFGYATFYNGGVQ